MRPLQEQPYPSALHPCREELPCSLASPLGTPGVLFTRVVIEGPVTASVSEQRSPSLCPLYMQLLQFCGVGWGGAVKGTSLGPLVPSLRKEYGIHRKGGV